MEIICVPITDSIYQEASERNIKYQKRFGNSGTHRINKNRQRMTGYLAESCIRHIFPSIEYSGLDEVDFLLNGITIDSKAQGCNSKPLYHYSATLYEEQKNRNADYYIFSRVKNDFSVAWICGVISKSEFLKIAKLCPAGTVTNNFVYDQSRYEIQYNQLQNMNDFMKELIHDNI